MVLNIDRFYSLWCHHISGNTLLTFVKSKLLCSILKHICKKSNEHIEQKCLSLPIELALVDGLIIFVLHYWLYLFSGEKVKV